jgi:hypothetical protein
MTRKTRRASRIPEYSGTLYGLQQWYRIMVQNMGWLVIADAKGRHYKITNYKRSLQNLVASIEHVMSEYKDPDRIHDLRVLRMNVRALIDHVNRVF